MGMAGTWTSERFPQFEKEIRRLTEQHRELKDEPLHLAIAYEPGQPQDPEDIYLFEVIGGWGDSNPDKELFDTTFEPNGRLPTGFNQRLHMILTTPAEFKTALEENWNSAEEIVNGVRRDYQVFYSDAIGKEILDLIEKAAESRRVTSHG
jgi:hypothetical protein